MRKRRGFFARALTAMIVFWLGLVLTAPVPLDACPMHGLHAAHGGSQAAHLLHAGAGKHLLTTPGGAPKKSNQCTCIGDCVGVTSFVAALPKDDRVPEARITTLTASPQMIAAVRRAALPEHALPPANGPPRIS